MYTRWRERESERARAVEEERRSGRYPHENFTRRKKRITNLYISIGWMFEQKVAFFSLPSRCCCCCFYCCCSFSFCLSSFFCSFVFNFGFALCDHISFAFFIVFPLSICWVLSHFPNATSGILAVAGWWFPFSVCSFAAFSNTISSTSDNLDT